MENKLSNKIDTSNSMDNQDMNLLNKTAKEAERQNKNKSNLAKYIKTVLLAVLKSFAILLLKIFLLLMPLVIVVSAIVGFIEGLFEEDDADGSGTAYAQTGYYDGTLVGDTVEQKTWNFLIANGATEVGAAALMGNIYQESTFNPSIVNSDSGAYGICQWLGGRKTNLQNYASSKGTAMSDVQTQLEFMLNEINTISSYNKTKDILYNANDASRLYACDTTRKTCTCCDTTIIRDNFERPGYSPWKGSYAWLDSCVPKRKKMAVTYYETFKDSESPSATEESTSELPDDIVITGEQGGEWSKFRIDNKIIGSFKSAITSKTFYIYNQGAKNDSGASSSWGIWCNRAATICLCSGYYAKNTDGAIELFWKANNAGYDINCQSFYNSYGLTRTSIGSGYSNNKDKLRTALKSGKYGLIYIRNSHYNGASGQNWTYTAHWLPIIGYQVVNGSEQIFVADPGHGGTGWYNINEFNSATSVDFYIVSEK